MAMKTGSLTYDELISLIFIASLNDEFRSVATKFGFKKPSSFTLDDIGIMVSEHANTFLAGEDQDSQTFAGASKSSGDIVCQYCSKPNHTADKCFTIAIPKNAQMPAKDTSSSYNSSNGGGSPKKPHSKAKKNTFSVKMGGTSVLAANAASSLLDRSDAWLLGSGANASSCNLRDLFTELQGYSGKIMTMSGDHVDIKGRGIVSISKGCQDIDIDNVGRSSR
ncbi:hypothetical protein H4S07_006820 [Coemansia furcata]|uniref:Uncharacterized protein n=1 Tax=Coemansia furcata TaxID=417177 RepID=A0ACC1KRW9_9FUNG|nr:hypothetical protein H4S07_006820 [Coemansia furcata]